MTQQIIEADVEWEEHMGKLDPYGDLSYVIGSEDDFWCIEFSRDRANKVFFMKAVVNSETGGFIENAVEYVTHDDLALERAQDIVNLALDWCAMNEVQHDIEGWNQDPEFFVRSIAASLHGENRTIRIVPSWGEKANG